MRGDWSRHSDLNRGPAVYETAALPLSYVGRSGSIGDDSRQQLFPSSTLNDASARFDGHNARIADNCARRQYCPPAAQQKVTRTSALVEQEGVERLHFDSELDEITRGKVLDISGDDRIGSSGKSRSDKDVEPISLQYGKAGPPRGSSTDRLG